MCLIISSGVCLLSPSPRLFHRTVRERVDKFFKENNIVSLPLSLQTSPVLSRHTLSLSSGPKDQLLDVPQILCLLSDCQPLLAGHGEGGEEGERKPFCFCCLAAQMVFGEMVLVGVVMGAGWGFFAGLVAMTCTHDARYTSSHPHTLPHTLTHTVTLRSPTSRGCGVQSAAFTTSTMEPLSLPGSIRWVNPCSLTHPLAT